MNDKGQVVSLFQFVIVMLVLGILLYAFAPIISTIWDLNVNLPNYNIARSLLNLFPIIAIIGLVLLYVVIRPREPTAG